ncbi:MAG: helix-turn-helix domain-containing protein [Steroidobacteraceae bacterium]
MSDLAERRREERERRRDEILSAALIVAATAGFDALTMEQVARQARLSRALIYVYFTDKDDLLFALSERALVRLIASFRTLIAEAPTGRDRLAAMGRGYVAFSIEEPVSFEVLARCEARDAATMPAEGNAEACLRRADELHAIMVESLRAGVHDGSITARIDNIDAVATTLWGFMHGIIQIAATKGAVLERRGVTPDLLFAQALELALNALGAAR